MAGTFPMSHILIYHCAKAWVNYFANGLSAELERADKPWSKIVDVLCVQPGWVKTKLVPEQYTWMSNATVSTIVECALTNLGQYKYTYASWRFELTGRYMESMCTNPIF